MMTMVLLSLASLAIGLFIFLNPAQTIELQRKFYEKINWRIEPISMTKEIRNTKMMGLFLIALAIATIIYCWVKTRACCGVG
jgi:hypothetical protein